MALRYVAEPGTEVSFAVAGGKSVSFKFGEDGFLAAPKDEAALARLDEMADTLDSPIEHAENRKDAN